VATRKSKKKPKLHDLLRQPPTTEEKAELFERFIESKAPIVTAILGQALIENDLDILLRSHFFKKDDENWKALTGDAGPLATFQAKITASYAFGACNDVIKDGLNTVRKIRNVFAHSSLLLDFSNELILKELKTVTLPTGRSTRLYKKLDHVRKVSNGPHADGQTAFTVLCITIGAELLTKKSKRLHAQQRRLAIKHHRELVKALEMQYPLFGIDDAK
jgi:hypothetical protein